MSHELWTLADGKDSETCQSAFRGDHQHQLILCVWHLRVQLHALLCHIGRCAANNAHSEKAGRPGQGSILGRMQGVGKDKP